MMKESDGRGEQADRQERQTQIGSAHAMWQVLIDEKEEGGKKEEMSGKRTVMDG